MVEGVEGVGKSMYGERLKQIDDGIESKLFSCCGEDWNGNLVWKVRDWDCLYSGYIC